MSKSLRHGYTTGACAAAAAKGAALLLRDQRLVSEVEIALPSGGRPRFTLHGQRFTADAASCYVVKDAGDDPDVTHGCEVWAEVTRNPPSPQPSLLGSFGSTRGEGANYRAADPISPPLLGGGAGEGATRISIVGGTGIGRVTKPGLAVAVGEWAINPVPRRMVTEAVTTVLPELALRVTISIPDGEERSKRTLNARLGILGGLSILGTTGIVKPISTRAWTDTLDAALDVAKACGCTHVVLATGRTSELVAERLFSPPPLMDPQGSKGGGRGEGEASGTTPTPTLPHQGGGSNEALPEEAYIMMGDHVGYALRAVAARGFAQVVLAGQFAKLLKIACGHEQTHVASSELDLRTLAVWLRAEPALAQLAEQTEVANTAREVLEFSGHDPLLVALVAERAQACAATLVTGVKVKVLLAGYAGEVLYFR